MTPGPVFVKHGFSTDWGWGGEGFRMIQGNYIYWALYFYYCYITCISGHQALDSGGWGPLQGGVPLQVSEGAWLCRHLVFGLRASRTLRQWISVVSSYFVCCTCLGQPEACCGPWGHKELDMLWLNWTELRKPLRVFSFSILWKHLSKLLDSVTMLLSDFKILNTSSDKAWCRWMSGCLWVIALLLFF